VDAGRGALRQSGIQGDSAVICQSECPAAQAGGPADARLHAAAAGRKQVVCCFFEWPLGPDSDSATQRCLQLGVYQPCTAALSSKVNSTMHSDVHRSLCKIATQGSINDVQVHPLACNDGQMSALQATTARRRESKFKRRAEICKKPTLLTKLPTCCRAPHSG